MNRKLTYDEAHECLEYCLNSGKFSFKNCYFKSREGRQAGYVSKRGYVMLSVKGNICRAHQIAWLMTYGSYPSKAIDHIDGNRSNNALRNLRLTESLGNAHNIHAAYSTNPTGLLGAHWNERKQRYKPTIMAAGKRIHLGSYKTPEEAHMAYMKAKKIYHPASDLATRIKEPA